jgi:hypothetical protein
MSGEIPGAPVREGNGHAKPEAPTLGDRAQEAREQAQTVAGAMQEALAEKVAENPYGMIAAAFAVGYVAGGGLFTKTTARMVQMGARLMMIPQVRDPLLDAAETAIDSLLEKTRPKGQ